MKFILVVVILFVAACCTFRDKELKDVPDYQPVESAFCEDKCLEDSVLKSKLRLDASAIKEYRKSCKELVKYDKCFRVKLDGKTSYGLENEL